MYELPYLLCPLIAKWPESVESWIPPWRAALPGWAEGKDARAWPPADLSASHQGSPICSPKDPSKSEPDRGRAWVWV